MFYENPHKMTYFSATNTINVLIMRWRFMGGNNFAALLFYTIFTVLSILLDNFLTLKNII